MRTRVTLLLLATALLGGCVVEPWPGYGPRYAYHPYPRYYWWR